MTIKRMDSHSTEFGLWLREQEEIDSSKGYIATNIDYVWMNYKTGQWMFIEEKRNLSSPKQFQSQIFDLINSSAVNDKSYMGFHIIIFEHTSPEDGKILLDKKVVTKQQLIDFLQFKIV